MTPSESLKLLAATRAPEIGADLVSAIADAMEERGVDPRLCGEIYERERARDRQSRRAGGVYYTPAHVVDFVVEKTIGNALAGRSRQQALSLRVVDPACGGAVFLLAALARIEKHVVELGGPMDDAHRAEIARRCIRGVDVDPQAAAVSRLALSVACGGAELSECVVVGDSLLDVDCVERGAWDAVIGNPPWGQKGFRFADHDKRRLRQAYVTATGVLDPFKLFVELAHELVRPEGRWAMVLPDIILLKNQQPIRDLILDRSSIEWIVDLGRVFSDVNLDAVVISARLVRAIPGHEIRVWRELPEAWRTHPPPLHTVGQHVFSELAAHRFNIHLDETSLARLRALRDFPRLAQRFEPHEGVHSGNVRSKLFVATKPGGQGAPIIIGRKEIGRHRLAWGGAWIDLDPQLVDRPAGEYANLGRPEWHRRTKILVRRTGDRVIAAYDGTGYYASNNLFVVLPRDEMAADELRAFTALLNSRFMTWYFRTVQPRTGKLFAELKIQHLVDFPLPPQELWIRAVPALSSLSIALEAGPNPTADTEVDQLVDELYGIGPTPPL